VQALTFVHEAFQQPPRERPGGQRIRHIVDLDFGHHLDPPGPDGKPATQRRVAGRDADRHGGCIVNRHAQVIDRVEVGAGG
jgi:hypothetical protein